MQLAEGADPQSVRLDFSMSKMKPLTLGWLLDSWQHVKSLMEGCKCCLLWESGDTQSFEGFQVQNAMYHPNWQTMLESLSKMLCSLDHSLNKGNCLNKSNCLRSVDVHPRHKKKPSHRQKNQEEDPQSLKTKQRLREHLRFLEIKTSSCSWCFLCIDVQTNFCTKNAFPLRDSKGDTLFITMHKFQNHSNQLPWFFSDFPCFFLNFPCFFLDFHWLFV